MIVCLTEKPNVALTIAKVVGASNRCDGYWEGNGYQITWTYGHLCTLKEPNDYTESWKRWAMSSLPMIPARFSIKLIPQQNYEHQFGVIAHLISHADEIINCGDAGQEGELIQRWVMQKASTRCPVKRLWISSLTDDAIREGFDHLRPSADFDNLYHAGLCRSIGDWILGMNATRLYSLKYSQPGKVLSIGRVQTPTLAMIVKRQQEIRSFKPTDTFELHTLYRDVNFTSTQPRFATEPDAVNVIDQIKNLPFLVTDVSKKKGREAPPRLFDLTSLQVEANKLWGWTAENTLKLIQSLYEKKVTTYPRVDTTYLTDDIYPKVPQILRDMEPYAALTAPVLAAKIPKSKKVFDNSKVTDHHAIIPTGVPPTSLQGDEKRLYHLIALRFISAFYPDCEFEATTVEGKAGNVPFRVTGKVITVPGWRGIFKSSASTSATDSTADALLPPFTKGESGPHVPSFQKKTSQPPKPYTDATLLRAMETAGKTVDDEAIREAMKLNGIGRPSTRAAIIETLFKRRYIERQKKNIVSTPAGEALIATINEPLLKSAALTGLWENKLRRIEDGSYSAPEFISEIKALINQIVLNVMADNSHAAINV